MQKTAMRADAIIADVERYLSQQYDERHIQAARIVRRRLLQPQQVYFAVTVLVLSALIGAMIAEMLGS